MNTAVFELLGKLAAGAGSGQTTGAAAAAPLAPLLTALPSEEVCAVYGQERPLLFFYDPHSCGASAAAAAATNAGGRPQSSQPAPASPVAFTAVAQWPKELSSTLLTAPTTSLRSLCVTAAEDDVTSGMSSAEVWAEWPQMLRGWQLCPTSHLCAVLLLCGGGGAGAASRSGSSAFYLLASRYELIGTSTVYERYLLLSGKGAETDAAAITTATCISVRELRTLRRIACLCRCFSTNGREVQPRPLGAAQVRKESIPPPPPADYFLRLVPTSLQYTFCFTTTALLSVAEEDRCQGWAMATTKLGQSGKAAGCRYRSCSTEAANTSGALSDGGHTVYQDSATFSRERSASAVRVADGAGLLGLPEDPRSATSSPARPAAPGRFDEQQHNPRRLARLGGEEAVENRLPQSQRWRALSLPRVVDCSYYDDQVPAGWRRWRYASNGILCRPLVVDSLDGIVRYIHGSRLAFYTAVAFLDRFIASTVDPVANVQAYRCQLYRARTGQQMDFSMMAEGGVNTRGTAMDGSEMADVQARDICGFLTQVIVVCIMLGSKTVDLYPPRIRQLMGCVEDTEPICEQEFVILELHVLLTLGFPVHPVTLFESVNALLTFSANDHLFSTLTASHTTRRLLEEYQDRGQLVDDVDKLLAAQAEKDAAAAVVGVDACDAAPRSAHMATSVSGAAAAGGATALTRVERHAMNDWLRLRLFTYFIGDEVIRADATASSSASSSNHASYRSSPCTDDGSDAVWRGECNVLQYAPVLVAAAALVVAAEQVDLPLPGPLLRLLPRSVRDRLRAAASGTALCWNEESNAMGRDAVTSASASSFVTQPGEDHHRVLEEVSVLLEGELLRLCDAQRGGVSQRNTPFLPPRSTAEEEEEEEQQVAGVPRVFRAGRHAHERVAACGGVSPAEPSVQLGHRHTGSDRGSSSGCSATPLPVPPPQLPRADPEAIALFGRIIQQVRDIHNRSRDSCPPVLLQRYQPLFREGV